jgi:hypothetical protein
MSKGKVKCPNFPVVFKSNPAGGTFWQKTAAGKVTTATFLPKLPPGGLKSGPR